MLDFLLKYWIEIIFGLIISCFTYFFNLLLKYKKKLDATSDGVMVILKMRLIEKYNELMKKESITIEEKEVVNDLFEVYKKFECCDVVKDLMKKINSIPIK